jgi:hypothetical protein
LGLQTGALLIKSQYWDGEQLPLLSHGDPSDLGTAEQTPEQQEPEQVACTHQPLVHSTSRKHSAPAATVPCHITAQSESVAALARPLLVHGAVVTGRRQLSIPPPPIRTRPALTASCKM